MMDNKDFVSYETAKRLKECGFDEPCTASNDTNMNEKTDEYRLWKGKYRITRNGDIYSPDGKQLKPWRHPQGYLLVSPYVDGKRYNKRVHQMVAETWIPNPENHPMINHINGIKTDNRVENLEWCSASHNTKHAYDIGLMTPNSRKVVICETGQVFASPRKMAEAMGWDDRWTSHITAVCRGNGRVKRKAVHEYVIRYYNPTPLIEKLINAGFGKYPKDDKEETLTCYLTLAQKWLRENYGIHIAVICYADYSEDADGRKCDEWHFWDYDIMCIANGKVITNGGSEFATYEQALQEGIKEALELINPTTE